MLKLNDTRIFMHARKTDWHKQQMLTWKKGRQLGWTLTKKVHTRRTSQFQLTGELKGNPKPPTDEATPVVPASGAQVVDGVEERLSVRASLPRACKKTSDVKPENTPSNLPAEKMKREKKPSDYQSAVARHLAESKECAMAYNDSSFRVVPCLSFEFEPRNHGGSVH